MAHLLKNGHPAHVFTDEDRRKGAAVTNQIRRERAEIVAITLENDLIERQIETARARRARKAAKAREWRQRRKAEEQADRERELDEARMAALIAANESPEERAQRYFERGYGCAPPRGGAL